MKSEISDLLDRPAEQRVREFKYRFAQSVVFGIPVLMLQWLGPHLGGPEAPRWICLLQALLAGWVVYVGAAGMLAEGLLLIRRGVSRDLVISAIVTFAYLYSLLASIPIVFAFRARFGPPAFHWIVLIIIVWSALRWGQLSRGSTHRGTL